jgi:hypothetical protein
MPGQTNVKILNELESKYEPNFEHLDVHWGLLSKHTADIYPIERVKIDKVWGNYTASKLHIAHSLK